MPVTCLSPIINMLKTVIHCSPASWGNYSNTLRDFLSSGWTRKNSSDWVGDNAMVPLRTRRALALKTVYSDSTCLILNRKGLNIINTLLALNNVLIASAVYKSIFFVANSSNYLINSCVCSKNWDWQWKFHGSCVCNGYQQQSDFFFNMLRYIFVYCISSL